MTNYKVAIGSLTFDQFDEDGSTQANVQMNVSTSGGVKFTVPMSFETKSGQEQAVIPQAYAAFHRLMAGLAEHSKSYI